MPASILSALIDVLQPYASFYNDHKALSVSTTVAHVGSMLAGGGLAITTDRAVLRMKPHDARGQRDILEDLATTHSLVITSLVVLLVSGVMFLAADVKTFTLSPLYWAKMAGVFLLLINGLRLWRAEGRLNKSLHELAQTDAMPEGEWRSLRAGAITSLVLWFLIMAMGVVLGNS